MVRSRIGVELRRKSGGSSTSSSPNRPTQIDFRSSASPSLATRLIHLKWNAALFQESYEPRIDRQKSYRFKIRVSRNCSSPVKGRTLNHTGYSPADLARFPREALLP